MSRRSARALFPALILVLLAGSLAGCTADSARTVVLVTYEGFVLPEDAAAAFRAATGYTVEVRAAGDAGEALNRAILTAGRPEGDVFFGVDNTFLTRATGSAAFLRWQPGSVQSLPADLRLDPTATFTPVDTGDVCVNADRSWFADRALVPPASMDDLADPRYRGLLVVQNPARSSPGLAFLAASHAAFGSGAAGWWQRLRANDVAVADSWSDAYNTRYTVNGGDRPLVVSYATSPPAEVVFSEGKRTEPASVVVTSTCFRHVEFAAVLAGTRQVAMARRLVEFMLGPEWQAGLPLSNFVEPIVRATPRPEVFARFAVRVERPFVASVEEIGRQRTAWIDEWRRIME